MGIDELDVSVRLQIPISKVTVSVNIYIVEKIGFLEVSLTLHRIIFNIAILNKLKFGSHFHLLCS